MSFIPSNLARVPNLLTSQTYQRNVTNTNLQLLRVQEQLSSFHRVNRPSDDAIASSLIGVLDTRLEGLEQRDRNLTHAGSVLGTLDQQLGTLIDSIREAKEIASSQVGVGSDADTRRAQAEVIGSKVDELIVALNRDFAGIQLFGGDRSTGRPVEAFRGGYRYLGTGSGLRTDLGDGVDFPITLGADAAVGALSSRVKGSVDLNPQLTLTTRIADLRGPAAGSAGLGSIRITIDNGTTPQTITADLTNAANVGDVVNIIESSIRQADAAALTGAYPAGVGVSGERIAVNTVAAGYTISFSDGPIGSTAKSLGLDNFNFTTAAQVSTNAGTELDPRLSLDTTLSTLSPGTPLSFGVINIRNGGALGQFTTAGPLTIGQLQEIVRQVNVGARLEIDASGNSINIVNEVSGHRLSVADAGGTAALTLGIRSFAPDTATSVLNDGRGVQIADGAINPLTSAPDPARNVDFRVTLANGTGTFDVDLVPADLTSVQTVVDKINAAASSAGLAAVFTASVNNNGNGILFTDSSAPATGATTVTSLNGYAAEDLGLLDGTFTAGAPATLAGSDRATVRVDGLISTLIDLRDALASNNERGITFAGTRLEADLERLSSARATVGTRQARVEAAQTRLQDSSDLDRSIKSSLQDVDFTEAATRFTLLQTQLQAGYSTIASARPLSLINFL